MLHELINFGYSISAFLLAITVVIVANRMDSCTRPVLKLCLVALIIAAALFPMCKLYGWLDPVVTALLVPFNFGISTWLLVNRSKRVRYPLFEVKI